MDRVVALPSHTRPRVQPGQVCVSSAEAFCAETSRPSDNTLQSQVVSPNIYLLSSPVLLPIWWKGGTVCRLSGGLGSPR